MKDIDPKLIPFLPEAKHPNLKTIQITEVGSQMWGMADLSSDHDMVIIYRERTKDILRGRTYHSTLPCNHHVMIDGQEYDFSYLEIGHFCHQLKKGNINMLWALLSPKVEYQIPLMFILHDMIAETHTDDIIPSGVGMVESQLKDVVKRADVRPPEKALKTAYRTANFVFNHLLLGEWSFSPVTWDVTEDEVRTLLDEIGNVQLNKQLDSMPVRQIENWLLQFRVSHL